MCVREGEIEKVRGIINRTYAFLYFCISHNLLFSQHNSSIIIFLLYFCFYLSYFVFILLQFYIYFHFYFLSPFLQFIFLSAVLQQAEDSPIFTKHHIGRKMRLKDIFHNYRYRQKKKTHQNIFVLIFEFFVLVKFAIIIIVIIRVNHH